MRLCKWTSSEGYGIGGKARQESADETRRNPMNPMVGSGMQQACKPPVEQAVEVVRNHEDGTRSGLGKPDAEGSGERDLLSRGRGQAATDAGSGHRR
jgi:hypothetical protein